MFSTRSVKKIRYCRVCGLPIQTGMKHPECRKTPMPKVSPDSTYEQNGPVKEIYTARETVDLQGLRHQEMTRCGHEVSIIRIFDQRSAFKDNLEQGITENKPSK